MTPTALVVTSVHWPDDTRIRERLCRTLARSFTVVLATREPGPTDKTGLEWVPLRGGRLRRMLAAARTALGSPWDVMVIHDPELVPVALLARIIRRRPVVFDVHEDVPATALTRDWVPGPLRRPLAWLLRWMLHLAEGPLHVTLAESGYQRQFRQSHVVFPNFPDTSGYPDPAESDGSAVYLGDVTRERGAVVMASAAQQAKVQLRVVGPVLPSLQAEMATAAGEPGRLAFEGLLPNPTALDVVRRAGVGLSPLSDAPNYRDSVPTKILEYLSLGVPVVASDLPGTRDLVGDLNAVELVEAGASAPLAAAIERALAPEVRSAAREQATEVRRRFSWPADDVLEFYVSLV